MKQRRTSYAFLMEMLWVCGFFVISACILVLAFARAELLSRYANDLNHAVIAAQNSIEAAYASYHSNLTGPAGTGTAVSFFDKDWQPAEDAPSEAAYTVTLSFLEKDGLLRLTSEVEKSSGEILYTLESCRNLSVITEPPIGPGSSPDSKSKERRTP